MRIYSKTSASFIERIRTHIKDIMTHEMSINFKRTRFVLDGLSYPLKLVVFEDPKKLGYFNRMTYTLGLNKKLMYTSDTTVIKDVVRHELAHMMCSIYYPTLERTHGPEFRALCQKYGWDHSVHSATISEQNFISNKDDISSDKVINRVKKLLKLAESNNVHESELATIKANEILVKHNLKWIDEDEETVYVDSVLSGKKVTGKYTAIYQILEAFYIAPVFNYGAGGFELEVIGDRASVEIAKYVADFLNLALEESWTEARRLNNFKGISAKNSFMKGIARGHIEKIARSQKETFSSKELVTMKQNLAHKKDLVYKTLSYQTQRGGSNLNAQTFGEKVGRELSISPAIKTKKKIKLLSFLK